MSKLEWGNESQMFLFLEGGYFLYLFLKKSSMNESASSEEERDWTKGELGCRLMLVWLTVIALLFV